MLKEEWRTHSRLFGSYGFAAFPLLIVLMTGISYPVLVLAGFTFSDILLGAHVLVFFFGLNVGTIGFISRDAIKNVLGEQNLLIFSSRTLPISKKRILGTYLIKDLIYYSFLFIAPILIGMLPVFLHFDTALSRIGLLWVTATGTFMLGVTLSFLLAALYLRNRFITMVLGTTGVIGMLVFTEEMLLATPIAFFTTPMLETFITGFLPILALAVLGLALHRTDGPRRVRTAGNLYAGVVKHLPIQDGPIAAKSLLDVIRSSGSLFKIIFSQGVVFAVFAYFLIHIPFMASVASHGVIALAAVLGLGSITTYSWLNRFDRRENYMKLPISTESLFRGKMYAFYLLAIPTGYTYLVAAGILFGFTDFLTGLILFPLLSTYLFGVTAYLTGFDPDRLLFDAKRFGAFTVLTGIVLIPIFIALFIFEDAIILNVFLITLSALAAGTGHTLYEEADHRWEQRVR